MNVNQKSFVKATLAMLGTVIGAGMFALPAAFHAMGILTGSIVFWLVAIAVLATHLLYVEVILKNATIGTHRLPVQAGLLLGPWARRLAYLTHSAQVVGADIAYIILGGEFLSVLAQAIGVHAPLVVWQILFWAGGAATVFIGLRWVATIESKTAWILLGLILLSVFFFARVADGGFVLTMHWIAVPSTIGVFLFALFGWEIVPEVALLLDGDPAKTRLAVAIGSFTAAFSMWLFGVLAYAAIGDTLGTDVGQLASGFPAALFWLLPAVGFFAVVNPFLTLTQSLKTMLRVDAGLSKTWAWVVALGLPLTLFFATSRDFLHTVSFLGAVVASTNGILICAMAYVAFRTSRGRVWVWYVATPLICATLFVLVLIRRLALSMG